MAGTREGPPSLPQTAANYVAAISLRMGDVAPSSSETGHSPAQGQQSFTARSGPRLRVLADFRRPLTDAGRHLHRAGRSRTGAAVTIQTEAGQSYTLSLDVV